MQCNKEALLLVGDVLYVVQYYRREDCIVIDKVHLINLVQKKVLSYLIKGCKNVMGQNSVFCSVRYLCAKRVDSYL